MEKGTGSQAHAEFRGHRSTQLPGDASGTVALAPLTAADILRAMPLLPTELRELLERKQLGTPLSREHALELLNPVEDARHGSVEDKDLDVVVSLYRGGNIAEAKTIPAYIVSAAYVHFMREGRFLQQRYGLTQREVDMLQCLAAGLSNAEAASVLGVKEETVKNFVKPLLEKIRSTTKENISRYKAARIAKESGLASDEVQRQRGVEKQPLSKREQEVYELVRQGLSNAEIAARLALSHHTVKNHIKSIFAKLGINDRLVIATSDDIEHNDK